MRDAHNGEITVEDALDSIDRIGAFAIKKCRDAYRMMKVQNAIESAKSRLY